MSGSYAQVYARALNDPEGFWSEAAEALHWERRWDRVLDDSRPPFYRWFAGGRINTCYNAVDRHCAERADQPALIYDSPVTGSVSQLSFAQLKDEVARCAGALRRYGVEPGDYEHGGIALLAALADALGPAWTPAHEAAWCKLYRLIAETMLDGATAGMFCRR